MIELLSIPAIILGVEAIKRTKVLPSRFSAIIAIALGAAFGFGLGDVLTGIIFGLSASGVYSGAKAMLE